MELVQTSELKPVKLVLLAKAVPEECAARAQVMIVTEKTWHLIGPSPYRAHGDSSYAKPPKVSCPVIDVSLVSEANDEKMGEVIAACTAAHAGVINMDGLVMGLCALGGRVERKRGVVRASQRGRKLNKKRRVSHVYTGK